MSETSLELDVLIFGGGAAGLWILDELRRRSFRALLVESQGLGNGQTLASQGILHGGLKYALAGVGGGSTDSVREMPLLWKSCLEGWSQPDLRGTRILSPCCYLWRTDSMASRLGLFGARLGLRTPVDQVTLANRPPVLAGCPGEVFRVEEPVIEPSSFLQTLASRNSDLLVGTGNARNITASAQSGHVESVRLRNSQSGGSLVLRPQTTILAAGEGNEGLRRVLDLPHEVMQRRPLHMVMVRGALPLLFGHCVDGSKTRVTITSAVDSQGRTVWHLGGELAEKGNGLDSLTLIAHARTELKSILPGVEWPRTEWASYRINRAEGRSPGVRRPDGPVILRDGSLITVWPTKLVLVPKLAKLIADGLPKPLKGINAQPHIDWPRPELAQPPWETAREWFA